MCSSWNEVIKDMFDRNEFGANKYNRYLTPDVDENMLQHAYEEALDLAVYLKTHILQERQSRVAMHLKAALQKA
jgi:hypothetical protein